VNVLNNYDICIVERDKDVGQQSGNGCFNFQSSEKLDMRIAYQAADRCPRHMPLAGGQL